MLNAAWSKQPCGRFTVSFPNRGNDTFDDVWGCVQTWSELTGELNPTWSFVFETYGVGTPDLMFKFEVFPIGHTGFQIMNPYVDCTCDDSDDD